MTKTLFDRVRHSRTALVVALLILGAGSALAYEIYDERRKAAVWEELLSGADCDACAARKKGIAEKQAKKREAEAAADAVSQ